MKILYKTYVYGAISGYIACVKQAFNGCEKSQCDNYLQTNMDIVWKHTRAFLAASLPKYSRNYMGLTFFKKKLLDISHIP